MGCDTRSKRAGNFRLGHRGPGFDGIAIQKKDAVLIATEDAGSCADIIGQ